MFPDAFGGLRLGGEVLQIGGDTDIAEGERK